MNCLSLSKVELCSFDVSLVFLSYLICLADFIRMQLFLALCYLSNTTLIVSFHCVFLPLHLIYSKSLSSWVFITQIHLVVVLVVILGWNITQQQWFAETLGWFLWKHCTIDSLCQWPVTVKHQRLRSSIKVHQLWILLLWPPIEGVPKGNGCQRYRQINLSALKLILPQKIIFCGFEFGTSHISVTSVKCKFREQVFT